MSTSRQHQQQYALPDDSVGGDLEHDSHIGRLVMG
jgi:hypothetical protein